MTPKGVRWAWVTVPVPWQSGHTSGVVPWAQPLPLQVGQDSLRSTVTDFSQPKAASVKSTEMLARMLSPRFPRAPRPEKEGRGTGTEAPCYAMASAPTV